MPIHHRAEVTASLPVDEAFGRLADLGRAPEWNPLCVSLVADGPVGQGVAVTYRYRDAGRVREMRGEVTRYEPGAALVLAFRDAQFDLVVGFELASRDGGTVVTHAFEIAPKGWFSRLMGPVIRAATRRQFADHLAGLARLLA